MTIIEVEKMKRKEELLIPSVILGLFTEVRKGVPQMIKKKSSSFIAYYWIYQQDSQVLPQRCQFLHDIGIYEQNYNIKIELIFYISSPPSSLLCALAICLNKKKKSNQAGIHFNQFIHQFPQQIFKTVIITETCLKILKFTYTISWKTGRHHIGKKKNETKKKQKKQC